MNRDYVVLSLRSFISRAVGSDLTRRGQDIEQISIATEIDKKILLRRKLSSTDFQRDSHFYYGKFSA
jgi:hypothetical protein